LEAEDATLTPAAEAQGKFVSLLQPQDLARRLLPAGVYKTLLEFATQGVPTDCGKPWSKETIALARLAGPHVSALTPDSVKLIEEDIKYQKKAGFIDVVTEQELFGDDEGDPPAELKLSRVAVVPQNNRRGRIILNLSAPVMTVTRHSRSPRKKVTILHPSVNETTVPADDQTAVKELGNVLPSIVLFMYEVPPPWTIYWQKIDLSDGFWRMVVQYAKRHSFAYELPAITTVVAKLFVIPLALQMGWMNSPAYFCTVTWAIRLLFLRLLALTVLSGVPDSHANETHCFTDGVCPTADGLWDGRPPCDFLLLASVFVDDFMNGVALPPAQPGAFLLLLWVGRSALHAIHAVFPPPSVSGHVDGRDSVSAKKLHKGDATWLPAKLLLGFQADGSPGPCRTIGLPREKTDSYRAHVQRVLASPYVGFNEFRRLQGRLQHASFAMLHDSIERHISKISTDGWAGAHVRTT
jgi:uncharacterized membrane protein (DUF485 family)